MPLKQTADKKVLQCQFSQIEKKQRIGESHPKLLCKMPSKLKDPLIKELQRLSLKHDDDADVVEGDDVSAEWKKRLDILTFLL